MKDKLMPKPSKKIVLFLIIIFAFVFRFALVTWGNFPPGGDVGLHESVINSILSEKTNFFWNYYHMGGGVSATNPGYHIFVAFVITMTGAPDYLVQAFVAAFFSTFIILSVFLIVKALWSEQAAYIAAFLAAFGAGDISMLSWGGYPNIVALMLIPTIFYLFIQYSKFSRRVFLGLSSLLISALFLTHTFSASIFVLITAFTLMCALVFSRKIGFRKRVGLDWVLAILIGVILVSPYLVNVANIYFGSEGTILGTVSAVKQALLETRLVSVTIGLYFLVPLFLFFIFSKIYFKKFLSFQVFLFVAWILIPAVMIQSYLLGIYLDYDRFLYFLSVPAIVCGALIIEQSSKLIPKALQRLLSHRFTTIHLNRTYPVFVFVFIMVAIFMVPTFVVPTQAIHDAEYYRIMNAASYDGITWIQKQTNPNALFVADANYGWWLAGFGQRRTFSAVDPQYLIVAREIVPAEVAKNLLSTNYFIGNEFIQIKDSSAAASGFNPDCFVVLNYSYVPFLAFGFNDDGISVLFRQNGSAGHQDLSQIPVVSKQIINDSNSAAIVAIRENELLKVTEQATVYKGVRFANISLTLESKVEGLQFDWVHFPFYASGAVLRLTDCIAMTDVNTHMLNQIIFTNSVLDGNVFLNENPNSFELVYSLQNETTSHVQFFAGSQPYDSNWNNTDKTTYLTDLMLNADSTYLDKVSDLPLESVDYYALIKEWGISYIVTRQASDISRFLPDPTFSLVYKNQDVAIFKVKDS